jgi:hypothetical protein
MPKTPLQFNDYYYKKKGASGPDMNESCMPPRMASVIRNAEMLVIVDNTQPFARMGRKAYRFSMRKPGCRNVP